MQIVIKIDEDTYNDLRYQKQYSPRFLSHYERMILDGTPLPKGHGDFKDMGNLQYVFDLTREDSIYSGKDIERAIKSMKTIIEADEAESEEEK